MLSWHDHHARENDITVKKNTRKKETNLYLEFMVRMIPKILILITLLIITDCAAWHYRNWHEFSNKKQGFTLQVPGKPRHFLMSSGSSLNKQEFEQWNFVSSNPDCQFFIVSSIYDQDKFTGLTAEKLLDGIERPAVGFLDKAESVGEKRFYDNGHLVEEQSWQLENRKEQAISRTYLKAGIIIQLICKFPNGEEKPEQVSHFFNSFYLE